MPSLIASAESALLILFLVISRIAVSLLYVTVGFAISPISKRFALISISTRDSSVLSFSFDLDEL